MVHFGRTARAVSAAGLLVIGLSLAGSSYGAAPAGAVTPAFTPRPGAANDIAVGPTGSVWVVGTNATLGGDGIYHWTGSGWAPVPGGAVTIAVGPFGDPWVTNSEHQIFQLVNSRWVQYPGAATDIAVGGDGSVWVVGTNAVGGGNGIYQWTGEGWAPVAGGAVTIAVGPDGQPWVTNSAHQIFHRSGSAWVRYPGAATDIGVGGDGSVWVVGTNAVGGGGGIHHWTGSGWAPVPGGAAMIAVAPDGQPWVTNSARRIYSVGSPAVINGCSFGPGNQFVQPGEYLIACGDGNVFLTDLSWAGWGGPTARATGSYWLNNCTPDCAEGSFVEYSASVTAGNLVGGAYTHLVVDAPGAPGSPLSLTLTALGPRD